MEIHSLNQK